MRATMMVLCAMLLADPGTAAANPISLSIGADAARSEWEQDGTGAYGTFKVAYQLWRPWFAVHYLGREGYASVDDRILSMLSIGVDVRPRLSDRLRPYLRFDVVHQHEQPRAALEHQPIQALFGVGDGIRHRGGAALGAGLEVPFHAFDRGDWYAVVDVGATWFGDDRGPLWYLTGGASIGFRWELSAGAKR